MNQMRAMKIGLEQRTQMKVDTSWKIVEMGLQRSSTGALLDTTERRCM